MLDAVELLAVFAERNVAKELNPDLIILDFAMPGMKGIEAAPILKQMIPETPIGSRGTAKKHLMR
jgi:CheY-like chemotaxis protein